MGTETIGWSSIRPAMEENRTNTIGNGALGAVTSVKTARRAHSAKLEAATRIASFSAMTDLSTCVTGRIAASRFSIRVAAGHQYRAASQFVTRGASSTSG